MKKFGVLAYPESFNLGDEVQSVAAKFLLPKVDYYIDRESIASFKSLKGEKVHLLCNGWLSGRPSSWPPSKDIIPFFTSIHVTRLNKSYRVIPNKDLKAYYQSFGSVGCRDKGTLNLFKKAGIDAHFSACLTLTLQRENFTKAARNNNILLVDPFRTNYNKAYRNFLTDNLVPEPYRPQVKYMTQRLPKKEYGLDEKFELAFSFIKTLAEAKMVVTSRIHTALPCLALGTPVYFINAGYNNILTLNDRFDGLLELFNVVPETAFPSASKKMLDYAKRYGGFYDKTKQFDLNIDWENPKNHAEIEPYIRAFKKEVNQFISN